MRKTTKTCVTIPRKSNQKAHERPIEGSGSCHAVRAQRHLTSTVCNEDGRVSVAHLIAEKKKAKEDQLEEVT